MATLMGDAMCQSALPEPAGRSRGRPFSSIRDGLRQRRLRHARQYDFVILDIDLDGIA